MRRASTATTTRARAAGFTLLEVLVSIAILGLGLTAILSAQAGAFESAAHARNISVATGLLRCKMNEVEEHLWREGFQETDETGYGPCCETDDTPNMRCVWRADRPTFPDAQFGNLDLGAALNFGGSSGAPGGSGGPLGALGMLSSLGAPGGGPSPLGSATSMTDVAKLLADANSQAVQSADGMLPGGSPSSSGGLIPGMSSSSGGWPSSSTSGSGGLDPTGADQGMAGGMGGLASLAMSIVYPSLKILFEASTRRITATLTFREGKKEYSIEVMEWFSVPSSGLLGTDDTTAQQVTPTTTPRPASSGK